MKNLYTMMEINDKTFKSLGSTIVLMEDLALIRDSKRNFLLSMWFVNYDNQIEYVGTIGSDDVQRAIVGVDTFGIILSNGVTMRDIILTIPTIMTLKLEKEKEQKEDIK